MHTYIHTYTHTHTHTRTSEGFECAIPIFERSEIYVQLLPAVLHSITRNIWVVVDDCKFKFVFLH